MSEFGTPTPIPAEATYELYFGRDNGPSIPYDPMVLSVSMNNGTSPQAVLDFVQDVNDNTVWDFMNGRRICPNTEEITLDTPTP